MELWWAKKLIDILILTLTTVVDPQSYFWLIVCIVALQYYRLAKQKARFFQISVNRTWPAVLWATLWATFWGIVGGLIGSVLMFCFGLAISEIGLNYLWPLALMLMLINPRFLCFSYAGGLISLSYLLFRWPMVDVSQLMALVAILHLVESFLILVSGHLGAIPTYMKLPSGKIVGAFSLQRFWPIPLILLYVVNTQGFHIPLPWWPILKSAQISSQTLFMFAVAIAALGYGDIAITRTPKAKSKISAVYLSFYSLILLALSVAATYQPEFLWLAALFGPLGHELVIKLGRDTEFTGVPLYQQEARGLKILDVVFGSPAQRAGLRSGDVLISVNGLLVDYQTYGWNEGVWLSDGLLEIEYLSPKGALQRELVPNQPGQPLGIIPAPRGQEQYYMELLKGNWLWRQWRQVRAKWDNFLGRR